MARVLSHWSHHRIQAAGDDIVEFWHHIGLRLGWDVFTHTGVVHGQELQAYQALNAFSSESETGFVLIG